MRAGNRRQLMRAGAIGLLLVALNRPSLAQTTNPTSARATAPTAIAATTQATTAQATTLPSTGPTTQAVATVAPLASARPPFPSSPPGRMPAPMGSYGWKPMAPEYGVLSMRSIFFKGHFVPAPSGFGGPPPSTEPASTQGSSAESAAEAEIVFDGVTVGDNEIDAYLESRGDGKISIVHPGEQIAAGRIGDIRLDELDYEANGKTMKIRIGQNLAGQTPTPPASQPSVASGVGTTPPGPGGSPPPGAGPTGGPNGGPGSASATPSSVPGVSNDLLERLRQRRLRELQGK